MISFDGDRCSSCEHGSYDGTSDFCDSCMRDSNVGFGGFVDHRVGISFKSELAQEEYYRNRDAFLSLDDYSVRKVKEDFKFEDNSNGRVIYNINEDDELRKFLMSLGVREENIL